MDQEKLKQACRLILESIGENPSRDGLLETPRRFAQAWIDNTSGYEVENIASLAKTFEGENYDEMVVVKDIDFFSLCEHHMLPFFGKVSIGYIPNEKIIGISKLPRIVEVFSRRLQNQERMTIQIAEALMEILAPKGVAVLANAAHMCMSMRGVQKTGSTTTTSAVRGLFRKDPKTREEFFRMI